WGRELARASAVAGPMPREAPVTSAIRSASSLDMACDAEKPALGRDPRADTVFRTRSRATQERRLHGLGQQRQLPRRHVLSGAIRQRRRVFAGEAVVGELRPDRIAALLAHGAIDAADRHEPHPTPLA